MKREILLLSFWYLLPCVNYAQYFESKNLIGVEELKNNSGVAVCDYNKDGFLDFYVVAHEDVSVISPTTQSRFFQNNQDATFSDVTISSGLHDEYDHDLTMPFLPFAYDGTFKNGASWGDFNNDGFPDLFLSNYKFNQLYKNNGDGTFSDFTPESGLPISSDCYSASAVWVDYNRDGLLDLLVSSWALCTKSRLYKNIDGSQFEDVSHLIASTEGSLTWMVLPIDINQDAWIDLLFINDDDSNELLVNQLGQSFQIQTSNYGLEDIGNNMGAAWTDANGDGQMDLYITDIDANTFWIRNGNSFENMASELDMDSTGWAWQTQWADMDMDGRSDLLVASGYQARESNTYFRNTSQDGVLSFENKTSESGFDLVSTSFCLETCDMDADGDLDMLTTDRNHPFVFYDNQIVGINDNHPNWLQVSLIGTISNRDAIGTYLELTYGTGQKQYQYYTGAGFMTQSLKPVHFGLGTSETVSSLKVRWPSGEEETILNLPINKFISITEGENEFVTIDIESNKVAGCTDPNSCSFQPNSTLDDGSCSYLSSKEIQGATTSGVMKIESYSYDLEEGNNAIWTIKNGHILEGQGTGNISVQWGLTSSGQISVLEQGACFGELVSVSVDMSQEFLNSSYSVARLWNEALLSAIRGDYARPTVHARNLFHVSAVLYDVWALYSQKGSTYLSYEEELLTVISEMGEDEKTEGIKEALSHAAFQMLESRFSKSPSRIKTTGINYALMNQLGFDAGYSSTNYQNGQHASIGNYIADKMIAYGISDGSREVFNYDNLSYEPQNSPLSPQFPGNPTCENPNRWQPLQLNTFMDQGGNWIEGSTPEFISPEWGNVKPFFLKQTELSILARDGNEFKVYYNPIEPPKLSDLEENASSTAYKEGFSMVSMWGSHLDPSDGVMWDISPKSIGNLNIDLLPEDFNEYDSFYDFEGGGDISQGRSINPITNQIYEEQLVPRGDYTRVLAEYWANGPDSESPPGHWFTLLNYVSDHPETHKKIEGEGDKLSDLEWDVKSYFILGGAMHDAAISAWSIKGWHDYIRPISAIRYMAGKGQSSESNEQDFDLEGIPLKEGFIERVEIGDPLAGKNDEHVGKIKLYTWRGQDFSDDSEDNQAGVDWILAENWWPYQQPSFVTPPFAGYVSGHSTFSRAAAEVLTLLTGSEYFPGGMGSFVAKKDEFLAFEKGPSVEVTLQWATYRDASDQCSLSRIWAGNHPPADDIPGRKIGEKVGIAAFNHAMDYFDSNEVLSSTNRFIEKESYHVFPNPFYGGRLTISPAISGEIYLVDLLGKKYYPNRISQENSLTYLELPSNMNAGLFLLIGDNLKSKVIVR
ncbi:MAG: VCBS repeat-containing protein [Reichenbachiella sp.]